MEISEKDVTIVAFVITWIGGIFGIGKSYGVLSTKAKTNTEEIDKLQRSLKTPEGDPRFITYPAHDKMQSACQALIFQRLDDHTRILEAHDGKLDSILVAVSSMSAVQDKNGNGTAAVNRNDSGNINRG